MTLACWNSLRDLALIMNFSVSLVKLIFYITHHAIVPLNHIDQLADFLILIL